MKFLHNIFFVIYFVAATKVLHCEVTNIYTGSVFFCNIVEEYESILLALLLSNWYVHTAFYTCEWKYSNKFV